LLFALVKRIAYLLVLCGDANIKKRDNTQAMADYDKAIHYYTRVEGSNSLICADIYIKKAIMKRRIQFITGIYGRKINRSKRSLMILKHYTR